MVEHVGSFTVSSFDFLVLELVKRGVDVNIASLASGFTALHQVI